MIFEKWSANPPKRYPRINKSLLQSKTEVLIKRFENTPHLNIRAYSNIFRKQKLIP